MAVVSMRELLEAGVHFGHQTRRWNPKMKRFIFAERGGIYIINLQQTLELLEEAYGFARNLGERDGTMLFVGTKKQSQDAVEEHASRVNMPYVNHRWLGGLLTNWRTISDRIEHLHELRRLKEEGQLELLPAKERIHMLAEPDERRDRVVPKPFLDELERQAPTGLGHLGCEARDRRIRPGRFGVHCPQDRSRVG